MVSVSKEFLPIICDPNIKEMSEIRDKIPSDITTGVANEFRKRRGLEPLIGQWRPVTPAELEIFLDPSIKTSGEMRRRLPERDPGHINRFRRKHGVPALLRVDADHDYFATPSITNSYWAGFIAGDGCIVEDKRYNKKSVQIGLAEKDKSHLERFAKDIGVDRVYDIKSNKSVSMCVRSDKVCSDLEENFNIFPRKTFKSKPPENLNRDQDMAFIAGMFDADGTYQIQQTRPSMSIVGDREMLEWIVDRIDIPGVSVNSHKSIFVTAYNGNRAIYARSRFIDMDLPFLERKYLRWEKSDKKKNLEILRNKSNCYIED